MKNKSNDKKRSLYINIICPLVLVTILACSFVTIMLTTASKNCINKLNKQQMPHYSEIVFSILENEKSNLKKTVSLATSELKNTTLSEINASAFLDKYINNCNLYAAFIFDSNKNLIYSSPKNTPANTASEKQALAEALGSTVQTTAKNKQILFSCAAKFPEGYVLFQKNITDPSFLDVNAKLTGMDFVCYVENSCVYTTIKDESGVMVKPSIIGSIFNGKTYNITTIDLVSKDKADVKISIGTNLENATPTAEYISAAIAPLVGLVLLLLSAVALICIKLFIMKPLTKTSIAFEDLNGNSGIADMTSRIEVKRNNEIGIMASSINTFISTMQSILNQIKATSNSLYQVGADLASSSQASANDTSKIMDTIQNVKISVQNQTNALSTVQRELQQNIIGIQKLDGLIENQNNDISSSSAAIEQMIGNIDTVSNSIGQMSEEYKTLILLTDECRKMQAFVSEQVNQMAEQSQLLADANTTISQISEQTNLLAMNAAIEAAHAGEAGKGFSVVADEIRKLAEDSSAQSAAIESELTTITESINKVVENSELSVKSFAQIAEKITSTDGLVQDIENAMNTQQGVSKQVLEALSQIKDSSSEVSYTSKNMYTGLKNVTDAAENLNTIAVDVTNNMQNIIVNAEGINDTALEVSNIANQTKGKIDVMDQLISKFKLQ